MAETGNARAETLAWKPGPGGEAGLTDAEESIDFVSVRTIRNP